MDEILLKETVEWQRLTIAELIEFIEYSNDYIMDCDKAEKLIAKYKDSSNER